MNQYKIIKEMIFYGIIGAICASLDSFIFWLLNSKTGFNLYLSNFISINSGIACSFFLNTYINFRITDKLAIRAAKFFGVGYCGLLLSMVIMYIGTSKMGISNMPVKLFSVVIVAAFQFVLNKLFTYKIMGVRTNG